MNKIKFFFITFTAIFFFNSNSHAGETVLPGEYSIDNFEVMADQCLAASLQLISDGLGINNFSYELNKDVESKKTKTSFPSKISIFNNYKYLKKLKIKPEGCNTNFTFYYEMTSLYSCFEESQLSSEKVKALNNNFNRSSCWQ